MTSDKTGGPAFPCINPHYDGNWNKEPIMGGMMLRDYFAAKALQGMLSDPSATSRGCAEAIAQDFASGRTPTSFLEVTAQSAYAYADAMLAERAKQK